MLQEKIKKRVSFVKPTLQTIVLKMFYCGLRKLGFVSEMYTA